MDLLFMAFARDSAPLPLDSLSRALGRLRAWCPRALEVWEAGGALVTGAVLAASDEDRVVLGFDGRLDNRESLEGGAGDGRSSLSDAELLLLRYRVLGESFLDTVQGSFAVLVVDDRRGLALTARDGMGNRYLSFVLTPRLFAAASIDAALLGMPGISGDLDPLRLAEYYGGESPSGPETFFRDVRAVMPGEMLVVDRGGARRRALPRPQLGRRLRLSRFEDYVERFAELLRSSVACRLRGHDRVAVLTSGGLDSTPLAAWAARLLPGGGQRVTALSWRLTDPNGDESRWVEALAGDSHLDLHWISCDDAIPYSDLDHWPVHPSTPEQTAYRWFHQRSYSRAEALGHRMVLAGFSGDQLYAGADGWFWSMLVAEGLGRAVDRIRRVAAEVGWRYVLRSVIVAPLVHRLRPQRRAVGRWLTPEAGALLAARRPWPADSNCARRRHQAKLVLDLATAHGSSVERLYASRYGLDLGWPLRDFRLVEFALAVPDHVLEAGVETRPVLRAAVRGLIPEEVRLRRGKANFLTVFRRGLERKNLGWAPALLLDQDALWHGTLDEGWVRAWLKREPVTEVEQYLLCQCLNGELWRLVRAGGDLGALTAERLATTDGRPRRAAAENDSDGPAVVGFDL